MGEEANTVNGDGGEVVAGPPAAHEGGAARWAGVVACGALVVLVLAVFGRVVTHGWLDYDDRYHVVDNPHFRTGLGGLKYLWLHQYGNLYIPVAYTAYWVEAMASKWVPWGRGPGGEISPLLFQMAKPLIQAVSAVLVFGVLRRAKTSVVGAALGAAVFAVHPLQAEAVGWISETRGLLATMFSLGAVWVYLGWAREDGVGASAEGGARRVRGVGGYVVATGLYALALLSKPSAATLPVMVVVLDLFRGRELRRSAGAMGLWLVIGVAAVVLTSTLQPPGRLEGAPLWARPLIAGEALAFYLGKLVWPVRMGPDYGMTPPSMMAGRWFWVAWIVPVVIGGLALWGWRRSRRSEERWAVAGRAPLAGLALMGAALGPVLGLVTFDHQAISTTADRYMAMALLGPALVVAALTAGCRWTLVRVGVAAVVLALGVRAADQVGIWKDDLTLWSNAVKAQPSAPTARNNLGAALGKLGRHEEAAAEYRKAVELRPSYATALSNLAAELTGAGKRGEAEAVFKDSVAKAPGDAKVRAAYGELLARTGRVTEARAELARAVELDPGDAAARALLAETAARAGDRAAALEQARRALELNPGLSSAWYTAGSVIEAVGGKLGEGEQLPGGVATAAGAYGMAVEWDPGSARAWMKLGDAELRDGRLDEAAAAYGRAAALTPREADAAVKLGRVRVRQGRLDEAVAAFERALAADMTSAEAREGLNAARAAKDRGRP